MSHHRAVSCLVIGAGPAGLATAACLREAGVPFVLVDRTGAPGGAYRALHDGITLASPATLDSLPGLALDCPTPYVRVPEYRAYLARYAGHAALEVTEGDVAAITRAGGRFVARLTSGRELEAGSVVVATGMWSSPRWPDIPGLDRCGVPVVHARDWRGPAGLADRALLIIGGGASAIETAEEAARAGVRVTVAARRKLRLTPATFLGRDVHHYIGPLERLPPWLTRGYCDRLPTLPPTDRGFARLRAEGRIQVRIGPIELAPGAFDAVVAATGYHFATPFLPPEVARTPAGQLRARHNQSVSWPGLYVVGAPCANRVDSEFLRGIARDAPLVARAVTARLAT